jgi:hypothetical protein
VARFPDSQVAALRRLPETELSGVDDVTLAAYSGGTVWAFHPLRVAAGVSVDLSENVALPRTGAV